MGEGVGSRYVKCGHVDIIHSLASNEGRYGPLQGEGVVGQHIKSISYDCLRDWP